ncbi:BnaA06g16530D [Brassica napus]|uniref:BnaA06g16530D protein n=1 Tax=Brassica napus TaxID=3708 RepID=A0A078F8K1_BRANA|nr:BnaA06g16530D [Brassica napus]
MFVFFAAKGFETQALEYSDI